MAKAFSDNEQAKIREKLLEACRFCWEKYGYRKTSVGEVCRMSGISTGAFYMFFPSKEMLFIETSNAFQKKLFGILHERKPNNPHKSDLAKGFMLIVKELRNNKWIFSLREDYEIFVRKLPDDFLEQDYQKDMFDIMTLVNLYGLKPKVSTEKITSVVYTLFMSLYFTDAIGDLHEWALELLINLAVEKLFE